MRSVGPKGERQGWLRIKNCQDQFLTMRSIGPKGERQGWLRIKMGSQGPHFLIYFSLTAEVIQQNVVVFYT
jgi:hypothetical protein